MEDKTFHRSESITSRDVEGEMLLVDTQNMQVHQLNRTASVVWEKCDGMHTVGDIIASLINEYDVKPEVAKQEVISLIAQLQDLKLIMSR